MSKKWLSFAVIALVLMGQLFILSKWLYFQQRREIAITIDDLPFIYPEESNRYMENLTNNLIKYNAPAIGFVIANRVNKERSQQLQKFIKSGFMIGSHTYSHPSLRSSSIEHYIEDIANADKKLLPFMSTPKYFRYPYLAKGKGSKKSIVHDYLIKNHYIIAPITIDSRDYLFNLEFSKIAFNPNHPDFEQIKKQYLAFIWHQTIMAERKGKWLGWSYTSKKQILLMHANILNSYLLGSVLKMYKKHGYQFITINQALETALN